MRAIPTTLLLATLAPCIRAGVIAARKDHGTFNTYTDDHCGDFEQTIYAWEGIEQGQICPHVKSVKANIANDTCRSPYNPQYILLLGAMKESKLIPEHLSRDLG